MTSLKEIDESKTGFTQSPAYQKLKALAEHPFDLAKEGNLTPERVSKYMAESVGYTFFYATERVDDRAMQALFELAQEADALKKMERMQSGEIVNFIAGYPSENRPALHTATRDFFENPRTVPAAKQASQQARGEVEKLKKFIEEIDNGDKYHHLIVASIGGSDLGPKAHYLALRHLKKKGRHVHFISNIDPDEASYSVEKADLKDSLVLIISKSGTTLETATLEEYLRYRFKQAGLRPEDHFIAITSQGSPMDEPSRYREVFHMWDWIGGRYSTTSMVGGFMLSYAFGFDAYWELLRGANAMDKAALQKDIEHNLPLLGALLGVWNRNFLGYSNLAIIPYATALSRYPAHIQQVEMESNGKRIDQEAKKVNFETGPIIFGEPGTCAQHSFFQLLHQGTTIVPLEFIGFKECNTTEDLTIHGTTIKEKLNANIFAQMIALATGQKNDKPNKVFPGNRPSHLLLAKKLTPYSLGALLAYMEHRTAFQGFIWNINSFDQEGVQLGKVLGNRILERMADNNKKSEGKAYPLGDEFLKHYYKK